MRCFVAIDLDEATRRAAERVCDRLRRAADSQAGARGLRWVDPALMHVTLRFLGETADSLLSEACSAVELASRVTPPFRLRLTRVGAFPDEHAPRVLWIGLDDAARGCQRWLEAAEPAFERLGFAREPRELHPHVTLARSKSREGGQALRAALDRARSAPTSADRATNADRTVDHVTLYESGLSPTGPRYAPLLVAPLTG